MSNPLGYAVRNGPLEGLGYCGTFLSGGLPNHVGRGDESNIAPYGKGDVNKYWYRQPLVIGATIPPYESMPLCSTTPLSLQLANPPFTVYEYGKFNWFDDFTAHNDSNIAASFAGSGSCPYVMVWVTYQPYMFGGLPYCGDQVTIQPPVLYSFTVKHKGSAAEIFAVPAVGSAVYPKPIAVGGTIPPLDVHMNGNLNSVAGWLMRPTALSWTGQDPDNLWNRSVWHKDEIGTLTWTMNGNCFRWGVSTGYTVVGYSVLDDFPTPCPINPGGELLMLVV